MANMSPSQRKKKKPKRVKDRNAVRLGKKRARSMTPEQRREMARKAALARWRRAKPP